MTDDLSAPLGLDGPKRRRFAVPKAVPVAVAALLAALLLGFGAWTVIVEDPLGGEPAVVLPLRAQAPRATDNPAPDAALAADKAPAAEPKAAASPAAPPDKTAATGAQTITIIDGTTGKREQVTIGAASGAGETRGKAEPKSNAPDARKPSAPGGEAKTAAVDPRLADTSRHGAIPKIAADGARASEVYARAADKAGAGGGPRVALVVGRLGISASTTAEALAKLPGPVTLAFTPYGTDLERWVARARGEGHEVLLQVPMEPFDYPDNDPGPQTLLSSLTAEQNVDRLQWSMSRFAGYVGLSNYMGARFANNEAGMAAVVRETGKRGLIYFDDGSAARGVAGQLASAHNVPFAKPDVVIDAAPTPTEIDGALARLEATARERGVAVGVAGALPVSINRIAAWAKAAANRGIVLIPITAAVGKPKSS